ncbi:GTPase-GDP dissociation stimulator vimar [Diorhabda sublineata]|uniref:GTPase-GDP dissociation stimulator vimar n=1 Tax=Diorhabda sublineata TaxID=1163346 RepID=UPI0024E05F3D|nr:GTPase-GDP dissociation stimulator vimar [Diorhabda sublineata]
MSDILQNLMKAIGERNESKIIENLKVLLSQTDVILTNVDLVKDLLKFDNNTEIIKLSTEVIAETARTESNRKVCTDDKLINSLTDLLEDKDPDVILNSVRALGNICYENEEACNIIHKIGINKILDILKDDKTKNEDVNSILITKTSGLLFNLLNMHEGLIRSSLSNGLMEIVEDILKKYSEKLEKHETLLIFQISILNTVEHYLDEQHIPFKQQLCKVLIDIFKQSRTPEICVLCLEIFHGQSEQDEIKVLLAKEGICELLFERIEEYRHQVNDEDSRSVLKMACDFMVMILCGDDCMNLLYNNGQGKVYKNMITWLNSEDNDLLSTGILAIGNFARKESHCIEMANDGISQKLINILKKYNTSTSLEDVKIQHALLSTLKNLVIPQKNKSKILKEGLLEVIYPMIKIDQYLVVFKLLGTLRIVIDGQESAALDLISRKDLIERLVYWCYNSDHLGIRGEVPRLLSWLIKQCHSFIPFKLLLENPDSIKCIVEMISSNHAVMQNEAFYALTLLYLGCSSQNTDDNNKEYSDLVSLNKILINADIGKNLNFVLTKYGDKMDTCTIENILTLLEQICKSTDVIDHLKNTEIQTPLPKLYKNPNIGKVDKLDHIKSLVCN